MNINRAIWLGFFIHGVFVLGVCVVALDSWALATALPGAEAYCRGALVGDIPVQRAPLCFAVWLTESKSWLFYARDMLLQAPQRLHSRELLRIGDVAIYAIGGLAGVFALAWLWASVMTRITRSAIASSYLLLHALSNAARSGRRAT
ncbi:MAG: hypothetical protein IT555_04870 [Acetobacteraceae bacterium]|nr:hypothetical protein [Acetobacteraceae bacterium]